MSGIRMAAIAAALALLGLGYEAMAEESAPDEGTPQSTAGKKDKADKGARNEAMEKIRAILEKHSEARRAFVKQQAEKAKTVYTSLMGKDGDTISSALVNLYSESYTAAKAFMVKDQSAITSEINALDLPAAAKTKALERFTERNTNEAKKMEERQQERLAFAKSLAGLNAEDVKAALDKHRDEMKAKHEQMREEMAKKMEERKANKGDKSAAGKAEGGKGGDHPAPGGPRPGEDLLGPDFGVPPAGKAPKAEDAPKE